MMNGIGRDAPRPDREQTPHPANRADKYAWPAAIWGALVLHAGMALLSTDAVVPLPLPAPASQALEVDLLDVDEPLPNREPGGGTPDPGAQAVVPATAPVTRPVTPKKVAPKTPREPKPTEELVHPKVAEKPEAADVDAPDALLADAFDDPTFALAKPKAARTTLARKAELIQRDVSPSTIAKDKRPNDEGSTHVGSGPGRRGGPGGAGQGNGRIVTEKFAFGGPEGAFQADVCALPRGTASIGLVSDCPHLLTFFADRINVAQRHFKEGFPGIEDRVEWFGIKYTGQFKVEAAGVYEFRLSSDDGSRLLIDGQLVINNDGTHAPVSRYGRIHLAAGSHQLKLLYFQGPGTLLALQLFVTPPGRHEKTFRPEF